MVFVLSGGKTSTI